MNHVGIGSAGGVGGGISNASGHLTLTNVTVSGNTTGNGGYGTYGTGGGGLGGGIYNATGPVLLINSTVSDNTTGGGGGGGSGGGIFNNTGGVSLANVTVSGNTTANGGKGGGVFNDTGGTLTLRHTVVAANTSFDVNGTVRGTFSLIGNGLGSSGLTNGVDGNRVGALFGPINPLLGPLANNGGPMQTRLPQPGSPLTDGGDTACPGGYATDQRGLSRFKGTRCDIGAVEV